MISVSARSISKPSYLLLFRIYRINNQYHGVRKRQATIYDEDYQRLIAQLVGYRKAKGITQQQLAKSLGMAQHDISKVENCVRRLDVLELRDWLKGLGIKGGLFKVIEDKLI